MRGEVQPKGERTIRLSLRVIPDSVCHQLFAIGKDAPALKNGTSAALEPEAQVLVEVILRQLERVNPGLLNMLARIVQQVEEAEHVSEVEDQAELFIAGALLMHEALRNSQGKDFGLISAETVLELYSKMLQPRGVRNIVDEAASMLRVDGNKNITTLLLDTFMTVKRSARPGVKHNLRSAFAQGCKFMYWLWHTQAEGKQI